MSDRTFVIHWLPARDKIVIVGINSLTILLFIYTNVMKLKNLLVWTQISGTIDISYQSENMEIFFCMRVQPTTDAFQVTLLCRGQAMTASNSTWKKVQIGKFLGFGYFTCHGRLYECLSR